MNIYLVGYMASGKSKAGEELASALKYSFVDLDQEIEKGEGCSISNIFKEKGEKYFRKTEQEYLFKCVNLSDSIISTGGGLPAYESNMKWMNENGITVYLEANAGLLFHRLLSNRQNRPLLEGLNEVELMEKIKSHLVERGPFYSMAKVTFPSLNFNVKKLIEKINKLKLLA